MKLWRNRIALIDCERLHPPAVLPVTIMSARPEHVYAVRPRKDKRGVDLVSDALPFGGLWNRARIVFDWRPF